MKYVYIFLTLLVVFIAGWTLFLMNFISENTEKAKQHDWKLGYDSGFEAGKQSGWVKGYNAKSFPPDMTEQEMICYVRCKN